MFAVSAGHSRIQPSPCGLLATKPARQLNQPVNSISREEEPEVLFSR